MRLLLSYFFVFLAGLTLHACQHFGDERPETEPIMPEGHRYPSREWNTKVASIDGRIAIISIAGEFDMSFLNFDEKQSVSLYSPTKVRDYVNISRENDALIIDGIGNRDFAWGWYDENTAPDKYYPRPISYVPGVMTISVSSIEEVNVVDSFVMIGGFHSDGKLRIESDGKASIYADYTLQAKEIEIIAKGRSYICLDNIDCESLVIHNESRKDIVVSGCAGSSTLSISGAGSIIVSNLVCESVTEETYGGGEIVS